MSSVALVALAACSQGASPAADAPPGNEFAIGTGVQADACQKSQSVVFGRHAGLRAEDLTVMGGSLSLQDTGTACIVTVSDDGTCGSTGPAGTVSLDKASKIVNVSLLGTIVSATLSDEDTTGSVNPLASCDDFENYAFGIVDSVVQNNGGTLCPTGQDDPDPSLPEPPFDADDPPSTVPAEEATVTTPDRVAGPRGELRPEVGVDRTNEPQSNPGWDPNSSVPQWLGDNECTDYNQSCAVATTTVVCHVPLPVVRWVPIQGACYRHDKCYSDSSNCDPPDGNNNGTDDWKDIFACNAALKADITKTCEEGCRAAGIPDGTCTTQCGWCGGRFKFGTDHFGGGGPNGCGKRKADRFCENTVGQDGGTITVGKEETTCRTTTAICKACVAMSHAGQISGDYQAATCDTCDANVAAAKSCVLPDSTHGGFGIVQPAKNGKSPCYK